MVLEEDADPATSSSLQWLAVKHGEVACLWEARWHSGGHDTVIILEADDTALGSGMVEERRQRKWTMADRGALHPGHAPCTLA